MDIEINESIETINKYIYIVKNYCKNIGSYGQRVFGQQWLDFMELLIYKNDNLEITDHEIVSNVKIFNTIEYFDKLYESFMNIEDINNFFIVNNVKKRLIDNSSKSYNDVLQKIEKEIKDQYSLVIQQFNNISVAILKYIEIFAQYSFSELKSMYEKSKKYKFATAIFINSLYKFEKSVYVEYVESLMHSLLNNIDITQNTIEIAQIQRILNIPSFTPIYTEEYKNVFIPNLRNHTIYDISSLLGKMISPSTEITPEIVEKLNTIRIVPRVGESEEINDNCNICLNGENVIHIEKLDLEDDNKKMLKIHNEIISTAIIHTNNLKIMDEIMANKEIISISTLIDNYLYYFNHDLNTLRAKKLEITINELNEMILPQYQVLSPIGRAFENIISEKFYELLIKCKIPNTLKKTLKSIIYKFITRNCKEFYILMNKSHLNFNAFKKNDEINIKIVEDLTLIEHFHKDIVKYLRAQVEKILINIEYKYF